MEKNKFIITAVTKLNKKDNDNTYEERYAIIDNKGPHSTGYPCFGQFLTDAVTFISKKEAKKWWNQNRKFLIPYYDGRIKTDSITIKKIELTEIEKLELKPTKT